MERKKHDAMFDAACEQYAGYGVDVKKAIETLGRIPISIHCWQGDDVGGFEQPDAALAGGGIQATGNYPGKARTVEELRGDFEKAISLIGGTHRINLHASYLDNGGRFVDRDAIGPEHFRSWIEWAKGLGIGIDFNPTFFSHPKADDGFTLSHPDPGVRDFWIEHGRRCRVIAEEMARSLGSPSVVNFWVPDGYKDLPADRLVPRKRLAESLDMILGDTLEKGLVLDAVESKLFGIGAESYTVGSHEFYLGYAVDRGTLLCLDSGHFHPTEMISDKISAVLTFLDEILLHVSRPVRWDSDHVVILSDEIRAIASEIVWNGFLDRVHIGLDFFDASINRIAAWVIGTRAMQKALLLALLSPAESMSEAEASMDYTARLALMEDSKSLPFGAAWDRFCLEQDVLPDGQWLDAVRDYEKKVLAGRGILMKSECVMNQRERFRAVMQFKVPDRLPCIEWAGYWDQTLLRWKDEGLDFPLSEPAWLTDAAAVRDSFGLDRYYQRWFWPRTEKCPHPERHGAALIRNREDYHSFKKYLYPKPLDLSMVEDWARYHEKGDAVIWFTLEGYFWFPRSLLGIEPHMYSFYDQPDLLHEINSDLTEYSLWCVEELLKVVKPDFMTFAEDLSYNLGPMLSRENYEDFLVPYYQQVLPVLRENDIYAFMDSDGDIAKVIPWMEETGIQGVLPLERMAGVDVGQIRRDHPEFRMIGGFDKTVMHEGETALRNEFERLLGTMAAGGYIPSVDHQTPPGVSLECYKVYVQLLFEYARKAAEMMSECSRP